MDHLKVAIIRANLPPPSKKPVLGHADWGPMTPEQREAWDRIADHNWAVLTKKVPSLQSRQQSHTKCSEKTDAIEEAQQSASAPSTPK